MNEQAIEFVVSGIVTGEELLGEPYLAIIGRCGETAIRQGDEFRYVVQVDEPETLEDYEREPIEVARQEVDLIVRAIHAYGQERSELDRGMTGTLFLTGQGVECVGRSSILHGGETGRISLDRTVIETGRP